MPQSVWSHSVVTRRRKFDLRGATKSNDSFLGPATPIASVLPRPPTQFRIYLNPADRWLGAGSERTAPSPRIPEWAVGRRARARSEERRVGEECRSRWAPD